MALNAQQRQMAALIIGLGMKRGLSLTRARELAAAAYAESGLTPTSTNKSSGAAGLFQLLSSGYRQKAKGLGGLYNPTANTLAILPDYVNYWRSHPNAAPGDAGRDVERSGEGSGFYSGPLSLIPNTGGGPAVAPSPAVGPAPGPAQSTGVRQQLAQALMSGQNVDWLGLARTASAARQAGAAAPAPQGGAAVPAHPATGAPVRGFLAEAFYDPLGSWDNGRFGGPIGHHSDHVHLSITNPKAMISAISHAQQMGLRVGENPYLDQVDPVHVKGSYHYRNFPGRYGGKHLGEAIDVSGDPKGMAAFYHWATRNLR